MKEKSEEKPEDILIQEDFTREVLTCNPDNVKVIDNKETEMASLIYSFLTSSGSSLSASEKQHVKNQLKSSVRKLRLKKFFREWSVAASVLVIFSILGIVYFHTNSSSEIVSFAQTLTESQPDSDTRLILQDGQEVRINKAESKISYAADGENITIGSDQKIVQKISEEKSAFNTVIVPFGKRTMITLSEGSKVWLNSGSKLIYPAVFAKNRREVYIDGEAIFNVVHSDRKPFVVNTRDFEIKVLGTVFNVSSYSDDKYSNTVLEQGKVEFSYQGNTLFARQKLTISPGTMAVFDTEQKTFQKQLVNPHAYMSWREGYFIFNREKLSAILKKISRYYNVEILLQNEILGNETFSGNLDLKNTPEEVLDVIAETTPFIYKYENEEIVINPK